VKAGMTQEDLAELTRATKELKEKQETSDPPEALKAVPSLSLHDIPKNPKHVPIEVFFCGLDHLPMICFFFPVYYVN
jgi:presequence protease